MRAMQRSPRRAFTAALNTKYSPQTYEKAVFYEPGEYQDWMGGRCFDSLGVKRTEWMEWN